jgi:hypothetical protein
VYKDEKSKIVRWLSRILSIGNKLSLSVSSKDDFKIGKVKLFSKNKLLKLIIMVSNSIPRSLDG